MSPLLGLTAGRLSPKPLPLRHEGMKAATSSTGAFQQTSCGIDSTKYEEPKSQAFSQTQPALGKLSYAAVLKRTVTKRKNLSIRTISSFLTIDSNATNDSTNTNLSDKSSYTTPSESKTTQRGSSLTFPLEVHSRR
jgi:hypothetical protein